jgi:hypothetical protein
MKRLFTLLFLLVGPVVFGQDTEVTKSKLLKIFKESIRQHKSGKISINSNPWVICNRDSSFYKSDTLRLYNNENYYYHSNCCEFIDWIFYKKGAFVQTRAQICKEPPTVSITRNDDWFSIKVSKKGSGLFFDASNRDRITERYQVISIDKVDSIGQPNDIKTVVTLIR